MGKYARLTIVSVVGIIIVAMTVLHQLEIITLNSFILSWWFVIPILLGIILFIQKPWSGESISCVLIGVVFLIKQLNLLSSATVSKLFWPCIFIIIGLSIIFEKVKVKR